MKSLYRRYRPTKLEDVIGQNQVTDTLASALKAGKIGHAYLFIGPRGTGKTSVARIFAHEVNGFSYEVEDDYVDIVEIDGASNRGIDNIRDLIEKAAVAPTAGKYKIYIIDEVHMLTKEAFNALLKTLEEPPEHVIFIMATTDAYKVPVTITSRAQTYEFKLAPAEVMVEHLRGICEKEGIKIDDDALELVVKRGGGSFRDSLSLLDQISKLSDDLITKDMVIRALGLPSDVKITTLLSEITSGNVVKITTLLKDLLASGVKPETLAEEMISAIIDDPKPEYLALLAKLPEVKAPFAEAKLLVALFSGSGGLPEDNFFRDGVAPARRYGRSNPHASVVTSGSPQKVPYGQAASQVDNAPSRERSDATPPVASSGDAIDQGTSGISAKKETAESHEMALAEPATAFNWESFLAKVRDLNDAIYIYLSKCGHEARGGVLHIYPEKKIAKSILSKDNNKRVLVDAAGMRVEIHEAGEKPENFVKDSLIDKVSGIMGGEVLEDGGNNPFE